MDPSTDELKKLKITLKRRVKTAKKYLAKSKSQLEKCRGWQDTFHQAELLQSFLSQIPKGVTEIRVPDWEKEGEEVCLMLDPALKPHEEAAKLFRKAKKLKAGLAYAEKEFAKAEKELLKWVAIQEKIASVTSQGELEGLKQTISLPEPQKKIAKEEKAPPKPYWEYFSEANIPIWVGKNAAMNDLLTFRHARGNDYWLHVAEVPGSHIIVRMAKDQKLDRETLNDALLLALFHSKARERREGEVILTQVKHVRRIGKEKGKVQVANEKRHLVRHDKNRLERLKRKLSGSEDYSSPSSLKR